MLSRLLLFAAVFATETGFSTPAASSTCPDRARSMD